MAQSLGMRKVGRSLAMAAKVMGPILPSSADAPITATTVAAPADVRVVLTINGALVLLLGILPGGLMTLCAQSIVKMLTT